MQQKSCSFSVILAKSVLPQIPQHPDQGQNYYNKFSQDQELDDIVKHHWAAMTM
jgi:hypothetical protein